jgi:hypothetical protein
LKELSAAEELDSCRYLYLEQISEPYINCLRLLVSEGLTSDQAAPLVVGGTKVSDIHPIEVTNSSKWFEVVWDTYISFAVRNESFASSDDEEWTGKVLRIFSRSKFLDFVSAGTFASVEFPGPFVHYEIACLDHIIDIASLHPPTIHRVSAKSSWMSHLPNGWTNCCELFDYGRASRSAQGA